MKLIQDRAKTVDLAAFLSKPLFAHLATTCGEGPRESPVWFHWDGAALWIVGDAETDTFPKRVAADGRCAIGIVDFDNLTGKVEHVGMRGHATVEPFTANLARELFRRYLGSDQRLWDERFVHALKSSSSLLIKFVPVTTVARDVSYRVHR